MLFLENDQKNAGLTVGAAVAPSRSQLIQLPYINQLRPSTLLAYLIACAPSQLPSPTDVDGRTVASYVQDLSEVSGLETKTDANIEREKKLIHSVRSLYCSSINSASSIPWSKIENETKAWSAIQQCEDIFFQRITVAEGVQKQQMRSWHEIIQEMGSHYFGGR